MIRVLENWFYNYAGALLVLTHKHGEKAKSILDEGLEKGEIHLGVPGKEHGFCWSMDGITWQQDSSSVPTK